MIILFLLGWTTHSLIWFYRLQSSYSQLEQTSWQHYMDLHFILTLRQPNPGVDREFRKSREYQTDLPDMRTSYTCKSLIEALLKRDKSFTEGHKWNYDFFYDRLNDGIQSQSITQRWFFRKRLLLNCGLEVEFKNAIPNRYCLIQSRFWRIEIFI